MKTTHTQGEWIESELSSGRWEIGTPTNTGIRQVAITARTGFEEEDEANAKLIASAPELLGVLLDCLEYFEDLEDADHDQDGFVPNKEMRTAIIIKDVIEKATS